MSVQLNDHQNYFNYLQNSLREKVRAVHQYNEQEREYRTGAMDFESSMSKMFQPLMAGMQTPINNRITALKTKVVKLENDLKRFLEVDINNYDNVKSQSFYAQYQQEYLTIQGEIDAIMQEMSEKYPQDKEFITTHQEKTKQHLVQLAQKLGRRFIPQPLRTVVKHETRHPPAYIGILEDKRFFLNLDWQTKYKIGYISSDKDKDYGGYQYIELNEKKYIIDRENGKYFLYIPPNEKFYLNDVILNLLVGNKNILKTSEIDDAERGLQQYINILTDAGIKLDSVPYIKKCRAALEERQKEKAKEKFEDVIKDEPIKTQPAPAIAPVIPLVKAPEAKPLPPPEGKGLPSDPISMFSYLYKYIAAKKAGHDGLDDNILNIMKKLRRRKLLTKEKQEELLKKIFVKNG